MAKTVGITAAIGAQLLLNGDIRDRGVLIPTKPSVYVPGFHVKGGSDSNSATHIYCCVGEKKVNIFYMTGCTFVSKKNSYRSNLINFTKNVHLAFSFHRGYRLGVCCVIPCCPIFEFLRFRASERKKNSNSNI